MLKIFLVEDEIVVREGISKNIDWQGNGFEFVGEAGDGELGYPMIKKLQPDILITDIKMPFMDGLELSRLVKNEMPWVKIIILTGYNEFTYAKEAIDIGISGYILKPFSPQILLDTVLQVKKTILEEREQKNIIEQHKKERMDFEQLERCIFFDELVSKRQSVSDIIERGKKLDTELTANFYNILLFRIFEKQSKDDKTYCADIVNAVDKLLAFLLSVKNVLVFNRNAEGYALILKGDTLEEVEQSSAMCIKELQEIIKAYDSLSYFVGVGDTVTRISELPKCFESAGRAFAFRYIIDENQVVFADQAAASLYQPVDTGLTNVNVSKLDKNVIEKFLRSGTLQDAELFMSDYLDSISFVKIESYLFRQYVIIDIHFAILAFIEELGYSKGDFMDSVGNIEKNLLLITSAEQTKEYLKIMLCRAIEIRDEVSNKKYTGILDQAKEYIALNYSDCELSLNTVAAKVNISPSHFSTIFHQELGQTFIAYLTELRMQKAKELLRCSSMKSSEIAHAVGYKDSHYFSHLFKKTQDCTPMDFRLRRKKP